MVEVMTTHDVEKWFIKSLCLASLIAVVAGCGGAPEQRSGSGAGGRGAALSVEALVVRPQELDNRINSTGTLLANEEVELRPETSGRVTGVYFQEGQSVTKGALMLKVDDSGLQAQHKRKLLEEKQAADEEARQRSLVQINAISQEDYDKALNNLRLIQADKEVIESQIAKTEIRAPFTGVVGLRYVSEGGYVTPNMLVATMQQLDPIKVEFSVPEKYAMQIKRGTAITVSAGHEEENYAGSIYALEAKVDPGTRTIKARGRIPNVKGTLIPGAFAKVQITLDKLTDALIVPSGAVIPEMNGEKVYIYVNGRAKSTPIKTGIRTETSVQVVGGISANDTLIVTGLLQLADGKEIQIKSLKAN